MFINGGLIRPDRRIPEDRLDTLTAALVVVGPQSIINTSVFSTLVAITDDILEILCQHLRLSVRINVLTSVLADCTHNLITTILC